MTEQFVLSIQLALQTARRLPLTTARIKRDLSNLAVANQLGHAEFFTMAILLSDDDTLRVEEAASVLLQHGLSWSLGRADLERLLQGVLGDVPAAFVKGKYGRIGFVNVRMALAELGSIGIDRNTIFLAIAAERRKPKARDIRAAAPTARLKTAASAGPQPRANKSGVAKRAAAERAATSTPSAAPAATPTTVGVAALHEGVAAAPAFAPAPSHTSWLTPSDMARLMTQPPVSLLDASVTLRAYVIAAAGSFTELLSPAALSGVTPHRYQHETVERVLRVFRGRALLADEVGLGKTIEAMMVLREYQLRGMANRVLIVVPAPLVRQWMGELEAKAGIMARSTDDALFDSDPAQFFREDGVIVASLSKLRTTKNLPLFTERPWDLVVVDEAHHVKNRSTASWKAINGLEARFLLLLTATPIETDLEEIYNLVTLLRPGQFQTPQAFKAQFVDKNDPTSPRNRERLRALLGEVMVRNTRAASGLKLPPRFVTTSLVEPAEPERALYEAVVAFVRSAADKGRRAMLGQTLLLEAGSSPDAVLATLKKAETGAEASALVALANEAVMLSTRKLEHLIALLQAHQAHALVFTRFRESAMAITRALAKAKIDNAQFIGGMSSTDKAQALQRFRDDKCVLVATDVGGEGQNLQHCSVLVNFDVPWNPMLLEQRIGRLHRMGQTNEVNVYNLASRGTAEEKLLDVLDRRVHLFELVVGEMDMVLGNMADDRDLEDRVLALYAATKTESDVDAGFDAIAQELLRARGHHEDIRKLDQAVFGEDFNA